MTGSGGDSKNHLYMSNNAEESIQVVTDNNSAEHKGKNSHRTLHSELNRVEISSTPFSALSGDSVFCLELNMVKKGTFMKWLGKRDY